MFGRAIRAAGPYLGLSCSAARPASTVTTAKSVVQLLCGPIFSEKESPSSSSWAGALDDIVVSRLNVSRS